MTVLLAHGIGGLEFALDSSILGGMAIGLVILVAVAVVVRCLDFFD